MIITWENVCCHSWADWAETCFLSPTLVHLTNFGARLQVHYLSHYLINLRLWTTDFKYFAWIFSECSESFEDIFFQSQLQQIDLFWSATFLSSETNLDWRPSLVYNIQMYGLIFDHFSVGIPRFRRSETHCKRRNWKLKFIFIKILIENNLTQGNSKKSNKSKNSRKLLL